MTSPYVLELKNYRHVLSDPARNDTFTVRIEKDIQLERGRFVSILGDSGCGKTTLLTLLGLLRAPDLNIQSSDVNGYGPCFLFNFIDDSGNEKRIDVFELWHRRKNKVLETIRRKYIGFALQSGELLMAFNVRQNIEVPLHLNGITGKAATERVNQLLDAFELQSSDNSGKSLGNSLISKLSGGEFQRVVLARSIAHSPQLILIDEPTSALNRELAIKALVQLKRMRESSATPTTIIMITHDRQLAYDFSDVIVQMGPDGNSGYIKDIITQNPPTIEEILLEEEKRKQKEARYGSKSENVQSAQQNEGVQNSNADQEVSNASASSAEQNSANQPENSRPQASQENPPAIEPPAPEAPPAPTTTPETSDGQDAEKNQ